MSGSKNPNNIRKPDKRILGLRNLFFLNIFERKIFDIFEKNVINTKFTLEGKCLILPLNLPLPKFAPIYSGIYSNSEDTDEPFRHFITDLSASY